MTKLQVADRAQAIVRARDTGLGRQPMTMEHTPRHDPVHDATRGTG